MGIFALHLLIHYVADLSAIRDRTCLLASFLPECIDEDE